MFEEQIKKNKNILLEKINFNDEFILLKDISLDRAIEALLQEIF